MTQDEATVFGIIGLGYVGLPLGVEAAKSGIRVIGFDVKETVAAGISAGRSHVQSVSDDDVAALTESGMLSATTDMSSLRDCDVISICVPTPLSKTRDPDVSHILAASEAVTAGLKEGQLLILESTTYPGTTREVLLPALEKTGLHIGKDFHLCFSPERVDPGNKAWFTKNTPKVVGGITPSCTHAAVNFYERFLDTVVPVSSAEVAELTKILENTFRAVNIGLVNETALIADRLGIDVWEVIDAAATKPFGFMKFTPGPGLGGHCIPVDPHYLSWKMRTLNYKTRFIELASEINAEMPSFVADKVREALSRIQNSVDGSHVLLLGVAYKRDVDDVRESPAIDVMRLLRADGANVSYHDPFVPELDEGGMQLTSVALTEAVLTEVDAVVIVTDHSDFDYEWIVDKARVLIDARHVAPREGREVGSGWIVKG